ncbi:MAG: porphobilinogen synthase [Candidatus Marinimicrobia bacterium]|nr:porphobilinogen synthase [Candidatus Neomarinimicrobiota bacterium]
MNSEFDQLLSRPRRLRRNENIRRLVRETYLHRDDLIAPVFVIAGSNIKNEIPSMPDVFQYSIDRLNEEMDALLKAGITRVILFGIPAAKDEVGSDAISDDGIIQQAIRYIKQTYSDIFVITDVCMCEYTDHGHCGIIVDGDVHNDQTLTYLQRQVVSHAKAGADMVAPSGMMDGMISAIRTGLNDHGFNSIPIMSYAVKYSSAFYGPFREAADSTPHFGDRKTYQMDPANVREGIKEALLDVDEGADIIMVKPALAYLDIISMVKENTLLPVACYNVSGEYSMIKAAAQKGWIDEDKVMMESLISMKRAGADIIITYFAKQASSLLNKV